MQYNNFNGLCVFPGQTETLFWQHIMVNYVIITRNVYVCIPLHLNANAVNIILLGNCQMF